MAQSNWSGPISSENGYYVQPLGSNSYYMAVDPADGYLKIGGGSSVGSNVGLIIQSDGTVNVTADVDISQIDLADGTAGAPSLSFQSDDDSGLYYSSGAVRAAFGGAEIWQWSGTGVNMASGTALQAANGTEAAPAIHFADGDTDSGFYRQAGDDIRVTIGGSTAMSWNATNISASKDVAVSQSVDSGASVLSVANTSSTSPVARIRAQSSGVNELILNDTGGEEVRLQWDSGTLYLGTSSVPSNEPILTAVDSSKTVSLGNSIYPNVNIGQGNRIVCDATGIALYNGTPVAQAAHIADPSGGATVDAEARTAINAILVALENLGVTASA